MCTYLIQFAFRQVINSAFLKIDLARSADIASNILTGFGLDVKELDMAVDVLVKTFTSANTDLSQLGEAFKMVAPIAASAGLSFTETSAALGLLGNAGIQASLAGTSLRASIAALLSPSSAAAAVMDRLGVSALDTEGNLKTLTDIVEQLEKSGATTADMLTIFGKRAGPAMAALVSQGSKALKELDETLQAAGGTAKEIADKQLEGFKGQMIKNIDLVNGRRRNKDAGWKIVTEIEEGMQFDTTFCCSKRCPGEKRKT